MFKVFFCAAIFKNPRRRLLAKSPPKEVLLKFFLKDNPQKSGENFGPDRLFAITNSQKKVRTNIENNIRYTIFLLIFAFNFPERMAFSLSM